MRRALALLAFLVLAAVITLPMERAAAQTDSSSLDPLELYRSLSPDQQDAIMRQLGGSGTGGALGSSSTTQTGTGGTRQSGTQSQDNGAQRPRRQREGEEPEPLIPVLKGEDWVIIEVDFHLPPRPIPPQLQALYLSQSAAAPQNLQALMAASGSTAGALPAGAASALQQQQAQSGTGTATGTTPTTPEQQLSDDDRKRLTDLMTLVRSRNPYQLSRDGVLTLPGFAGIALLGLTEDQASMRLKAELAFRDVDIRLTRLPLKKTGQEGLKPFGYDLFDEVPSTFAPVTNVPVPADYIVGAGDRLQVQLYGTQNHLLLLVVDRNGTVNFPELGPISVVGQTFDRVKTEIEARVQREMIGVHASVAMADMRSIRVFVLGEVGTAGTYTISGLGTITSALYAAGGVKRIGSLRNIQLKRQGVLVRTLDLYDLLIRGDTRDDAKLLPGDVIFVPPVGRTVSIDGEVRRPAIYEIKQEATVADVLGLAGGLTPEADRSHATLTRIDDSQRRVVLQINLTTAGAQPQDLRNGDFLRIERLRPTLDSGIILQGHLFTPGTVAYREGIRLSDVIRSVDELKPNADIHYLLIRREVPPDRHITVVSADLAAALASPGSAADLVLQPRDRITVFDLVSGRDRIIQPLMDELTMQSNMSSPTHTVRVEGRVKVPGTYPLESDMTVADLLRAGGGLADEAYASKAELTRYQVVNGDVRRTQLINIDLTAVLRGDATANIRLEPFDDLSVKEVPEWHSQETVTLSGEVRFPGTYAIRRGETLKSVMARAGGLTEFAFPEGSVFTREELRRREQDQIDMLSSRMQRDLTFMALQGAAVSTVGGTGGGGGGVAALSLGQALVAQLRNGKAAGRLVIDLPRAMSAKPGSPDDVILRNGDSLLVPRYEQEVTVIGEVQTTTSHLFRPDLTRASYINLSGGMTDRADKSKIYVVRANGSVVANSGSRWFETSQVQIKPGDTIVVPLDTERLPPLPFWQAVTGILYNLAIVGVALHSF